MATVVVQSDDLAAWIGVAGVAVGVVLAAGIESWRSGRAERKQVRRELVRAGSDLSAAAAAFGTASRAAGLSAKSDPLWMEILDGRGTSMRSALLTIKGAGVKELDTAALEVFRVSFEPQPSADDQEAFQRHLSEVGNALAKFRDVVRKAKL